MPDDDEQDLGTRLAAAVRGFREHLISNPQLLAQLAAEEASRKAHDRYIDERLARQAATPDGPRRWALPDIRAGIYRHYKGHHYLVLGYGHDSNHEGRAVVVYVGLELDGARPGPRLAVRTVEDFLAVVDPATGEVKDYPHPSPDYPLRFTYLGPSWLTDATPAADGQDGNGRG